MLQEELTKLKPALEIAAADAEVMIAQIAKDTVIRHMIYLQLDKNFNLHSKYELL